MQEHITSDQNGAERGITALDGTTKARIERAALTLFNQDSVDSITTKAIAAAAGISEGAIYRHFQSKEDIGSEMFITIHKRIGDYALAAASVSDDISEQAAALVTAYCQTADDDWALFMFHLLNMHRYLPTHDQLKHNPVTITEEMVRAAMTRGQLAKGNVILLAGMALGVVLQPSLHKAYGRLQGNLLPHAPRLTQGVCGVLGVLPISAP